MKARLLGLGAAEAVRSDGGGRVVAWFPEACYVDLSGRLLALVAPDVSPGPLYAVLEDAPRRVPPDAPVRVSAGILTIERGVVTLRGAAPWRGELPEPHEVRRGAELVAGIAERSGRGSALHAEPYRDRAQRARGRLRDGRLGEAAELLVGLGPGLTPSGDDAVAGALFAVRALVGQDVEAEVARSAEVGETGLIPRAFLRWAARGQALSPAHALFLAGAAGDLRRAEEAARALEGVGETSGRDFLLGLSWGLRYGQPSAGPADG